MPGSDDSRSTLDAATRRTDSTLPELDEVLTTMGTASVPASGRYVVGSVLGVGGMGEVRACYDAHMGREVAMKVIRGDRDAAELEPRFLAEARVQGSMEHPGIVPVHDLGRDPQGRAFFTMKQVRGVCLDLVLARLRRGDADAVREYSRHRLLTAFAQICLTVDFAHGRGVSHRDLKPANVMLGDHGEVYVLDWGIAKVRRPVTEGEETRATPSSSATSHTIVGTLGYLAPEMMTGLRGDPLSDVFSLGAILFEILTHEPIVADDVAAFRFLRQPDTVERRPRLRSPGADVPAELDAVCERATSPDRAGRFPTARALHDAVEAFLRGDRDLEVRRRVAGEHLARAAAVLDRPRGAAPLEAELIAEALREAGRAVVLTPDDPRAAQVLLRLLAEPTDKLPAEVEAQRLQLSAERLRGALPLWMLAAVPLGWAILFPLTFLVLRPRDWFEALLVPAVWCAAALVMFVDMRRSPNRTVGSWVSVVAPLVAAASTTVMDGPLILVPALVIPMAIVASLRPVRRVVPALFGSVVLLGTVALAWSGIHDPYHFERQSVVTLRFAQGPVTPFSFYAGTTLIHVITLLLGTRFAARYRKALDAAETRTVLMSWRLANLLPREMARDPRPLIIAGPRGEQA